MIDSSSIQQDQQRAPHPSPVLVWLSLFRIANLPTVFSNVLTGSALAVAHQEQNNASNAGFASWRLWLAAALLYSAGMLLNDVFDAPWDAQNRPDRPIPSRMVSRKTAGWVGALMLAAGLGLMVDLPLSHPMPLATTIGLIGCVLGYNGLHKRKPWGAIASLPLMGLCRGLVVLMAGAVAAAHGSALGTAFWAYATALTIYTVALTWFAQSEHVKPARKKIVPYLIAGMCLLDSVALIATGHGLLAFGPLVFGGIALLLQRSLPST